jgi:hypothetical protein
MDKVQKPNNSENLFLLSRIQNKNETNLIHKASFNKIYILHFWPHVHFLADTT